LHASCHSARTRAPSYIFPFSYNLQTRRKGGPPRRAVHLRFPTRKAPHIYVLWKPSTQNHRMVSLAAATALQRSSTWPPTNHKAEFSTRGLPGDTDVARRSGDGTGNSYIKKVKRLPERTGHPEDLQRTEKTRPEVQGPTLRWISARPSPASPSNAERLLPSPLPPLPAPAVQFPNTVAPPAPNSPGCAPPQPAAATHRAGN
jgi:hypothetical protein